MAGSLNKVLLIGNLGADPEIRSTPGGAQVANFRIACTESWTDQGGQKQERTEWVTCVAWRKTAELVQRFLRKGSKVHVEGKLQTRSWDDKNGGGKRYATEVVVDNVIFLDGPNRGGERGGHGGNDGGFPAGDDFSGSGIPSGAPTGVQPGSDDDLPF